MSSSQRRSSSPAASAARRSAAAASADPPAMPPAIGMRLTISRRTGGPSHAGLLAERRERRRGEVRALDAGADDLVGVEARRADDQPHVVAQRRASP